MSWEIIMVIGLLAFLPACSLAVPADGQEGVAAQRKNTTPSEEKPKKNRLKVGPNGYFVFDNGEVFLPLGGLYLNWLPKQIPADRRERRMGDLWTYQKCSDEEVSNWFAYLRANGVNTLRWMLRRHAGEPSHGLGAMEPADIIGRANPSIVKDIDRITKLAAEHDIYLWLALSIYPYGQDPSDIERFALPYYEGMDLDELPPHRRRFLKDKRSSQAPPKATATPTCCAASRTTCVTSSPGSRTTPASLSTSCATRCPGTKSTGQT